MQEDSTKVIHHRPRTISSPEEFDLRVNGYIELCRSAEPPEPITLTGMILALGLTSKEGFYHYATYEGYGPSVERARLFIENAYEKRLVTSTNAAANIFALKNMGWKDTQQVDANLNHSGEITRIERRIVDPAAQ
ncbi:MAG TPA: terminase small subunit [Methylophilaceae bacterium]|nr:terminase small subunit [Methylophilaceae bacterium]